MQWQDLSAVVVAMGLLSGCTTSPAGTNSSPGQAARHPIYLDYRLPQREFQVTVTYQLRKCRYNRDGNLEFEAKVGASLSPTIKPSQESFTFDPTTLPKTRIAQNVTISLYPNGTIKALNATSEDKTGSIISGVFKFVGGLVKSFSGLGFDAAQIQESGPLCEEKIVSELATADLLVQSLAQRKKKFADKLRTTPEVVTEKVIAAYQKVNDGLKSELAEVRTANLTIVKKFAIGPKGLSGSQYLELTNEEIGKWLTDRGKRLVSNAEKKKWNNNKWGQLPVQPVLNLDFHLKDAAAEVVIESELAAVRDKIVVRRPKQTTFELCMWTCIDEDNKPAKTKRFASGATTVPQWSKAQTISFDVGVFKKRVLNMSFSEDGQVTELALSSPARVNAVVTALAGISEGAATFIDTVQFAGVNAEINELETEAKLYKSRVALNEAKKSFLEAFSTDEDDSPTDGSNP